MPDKVTIVKLRVEAWNGGRRCECFVRYQGKERPVRWIQAAGETFEDSLAGAIAAKWNVPVAAARESLA
jgi:hypothetical protein